MRTPASLAALAALLVLTGTACGGGDTAQTDTSALATTPTPAPGPVASTDDDLDDRVEDAIDADATLSPFDIDAEEEDGRVTLEGNVRTAEQKTQAETVARANGATTIENKIEVNATANMREGATNDLDDRVEDAFEADTALASLDIEADDYRGGLRLEGTVRTEAQKTAAQAVAARLAGTIAIDNRIRVQP